MVRPYNKRTPETQLEHAMKRIERLERGLGKKTELIGKLRTKAQRLQNVIDAQQGGHSNAIGHVDSK